ncbi:MAG: transglycosylase SLT domain-containing protein, partial [Myxococcota bacterium]|nr:transglycosylase SLT domain-containing protein [Myxococcota bacterium]
MLLLVSLLLVSVTEGCADSPGLAKHLPTALKHLASSPYKVPPALSPPATSEQRIAVLSTQPGGETSIHESSVIPQDTTDVFGLIRTLERHGDLARARHVMMDWLTHQGNHPYRGLVCVRLARLEFSRTNYTGAWQVLNSCEEPDTLTDLAAWLRGEVLRGLGRPGEAAEYFQSVANMRHSPLAPSAAFRIGDALYEADKYIAAKRVYSKWLEVYPEYPNARTVRYRMAVATAATQNPRAAHRGFYALVREAPHSDPGLAAAAELEAIHAKSRRRHRVDVTQELEWASWLRKQRRWPEALAAFNEIESSLRTRAQKRECYLGKAKTLESLQKYTKALKTLRKARRYGAVGNDTTQMKIQLLQKMGKTESAVKLVKRRAGGSKKVKALAAAETYMRQGKYERAYKIYRRYYGRKKRLSADSRWALAWSAYRAKRYRQSARYFRSLITHRKLRAYKAAYWYGRALMKAGQPKKALTVFKDIAADAPLEYYGIQAANRMLDLGDADGYRAVSGGDYTPPKDDIAALGGGIRWLGATGVDLPSTPDLERDEAAFERAASEYGHLLSSLPRARDRYRMGYDDEARLELRIARAERYRAKKKSPKTLADRPSSLYVDNRALKRGLWGSSLRRTLGLSRSEKKAEVERLKALRKTDSELHDQLTELLVLVGDPYWTRRKAFRQAGRTLRSVPSHHNRDIFREAYPIVFEETLRKQTTQYNMSPYLMSGLARVESAFNSKAVSSAGARGLLQVMPVTGRLIAQRRGDTEFSASELLLP